MKVEFELLPPRMPNFVEMKVPPKTRQEGFSEGMSIVVEDLTEQQANEFADLMRAAFIDHWKQRKKLNGGQDDTK